MAFLFGKNWSRSELLTHVGHIDQIAGIRAYELQDGPGYHTRVFHVYTGSGLTFDVLADKALDIAHAAINGQELAWQSPAGDVHPARYEPEALGWLRTFQGGLLVTCGLEQYGSPNAGGDKHYGLHGRIGNMPTEQVGYRGDWFGDEYRLQITGKVRQAALYNENFLLERTITTWLGKSRVDLEDRVTNLGYQSEPHMMLYHCNFGFPLLGPSTRLVMDSTEIIPRTEEAARGQTEWDILCSPTAGYREQVFRHKLKANNDGWGRVQLINPDLGLQMGLEINLTTLPWLFQWKMMGQGAYVLGLEPGNTGTMDGRAEARECGLLMELFPGETRTYQINIQVTTS
jgi:hypothetical protein